MSHKNQIKLPQSFNNHKFRILKKIGAGAFGGFYSGFDEQSEKYVGIKIEKSNEKTKQLILESSTYKFVTHSQPKIIK